MGLGHEEVTKAGLEGGWSCLSLSFSVGTGLGEAFVEGGQSTAAPVQARDMSGGGFLLVESVVAQGATQSQGVGVRPFGPSLLTAARVRPWGSDR